jgi:hypothetical protein
MQKHRISTNLGINQKITVELKQDFDVLEILSLKFSQQEIYTSICSDYGVVCGRVTANNGFGLGNARVSIFIPLSEEDEEDPVISKLYPYKEVTDKDDNNYRYNLLPSRQQHGGHAATGTFPDQSEILSREEVLEVYEKYYKFTVKTNLAGDFMIWGVPVGNQTIHVDVDLSDIGCFSLRPYDLQRLGIGVDGFKNKYSFKSSEDLDSLPQIVSFDKLIEVYPFWGNEELCEIGITRTDFDLSERGVNIKPTAYLIGGVYTDNGKNAINKNCTPKKKMGRKCDLSAKSANIEAIRFLPIKDDTGKPYLQYLPIDEDVPDDGGFVLPLEMNMDYIITNEFGENEYTNDFNKGIATSACYRFRFNLNDKGVERARNNADYLVPNIREYQNDINSSYYFGTEWSGYPQNSVSVNSNHGILYNEEGQFYPRDYFYRFNYNKVYTVSSLQSSYINNGVFGKNQYLGLKELVPSEEEDCTDNVTPPVNFGTKNYTFTLLISDFLLSLDYLIKWLVLQALNFLVKDILGPLAEKLIDYGAKTPGRALRTSTSRLQINNTSKLSLINYPECDECDTGDLTSAGGGGDTTPKVTCKVATLKLTGSTDNSFDRFLPLTGLTKYTGYTSPTCNTATFINDDDYLTLTTTQTSYVLEYNGTEIYIDDTAYGVSYIFLSGSTYYLNDRDGIFISPTEYTVNIRQIGQFETTSTNSPVALESGCEIYDTLYDETLATGYFVSAGLTRTYKPTLTAGDNVVSTLIAGEGTGVAGSDPVGPPTNGLSQCRDMGSEDRYLFTATPSYRSEFANGVFYIVPGTQSSTRLTNVLKEYYRRKRIGKLFCGGIVNYGFIDNWLSGSLYFFQFKAKKVNKGIETAIKYCRNVVRFVEGPNRFYYRSAFSSSNGTTFTRSNGILGFPTTIVDLGPRDEFIKEICIDKNLDPNCSVSRSIGPTSFKSFGELMGLAINYRMDVSNNTFNINNFFDNAGFTGQSFNNVFDGDLLQLISINNEAGIEEFDLQNPKYIGYSYQILDPDFYPNVFKKDGYWGPLPVTLELDEDGERVRSCLNEPGRLGWDSNTYGSSQKVPFYLWDKKGTGFGGNSEATSDDQSWDYSSIQLQPLQGMTYGYTLTGGTNDPSDPFLLLPTTNTFGGLVISGMNLTNEIEFDVIIPSGSTHTTYDSEYPGYTVLKSSSNEIDNPISGTLYIRYGTAGTWQTIPWNTGVDFILPQRQDYYSGTKQILSTPFQFYFGLKAGKTGLDKFIDLFGPKGAFPPTE